MIGASSTMLNRMVERALSPWRRRTTAIALALAGFGCSQKADDPAAVPLKKARYVVVEIDAMPGATPSFTPLQGGVSPWVVLERNLQALSPPSLEGLTFPRSVEEVGSIDTTGEKFTDDEILELADRHEDVEAGAEDAHFHVLFLDGSYAENTQQSRARAIHIGGTRVIAVFGAASGHDSDYERVAEQSALVHEFGHAFGLVDLGIPDVSGHSDRQSPRHCNESDCVMGAYATLTSEAHRFLQGGLPPVLFGPKCQRDLSAYYE